MMARQRPKGESQLAGLGDALVFLVFVAAGCGYILWSKLSGLPAGAVTMIPVSIMLTYAAAVIFIRSLRLREDQSGDNLYYMGFLFTLTSLGVSLWQFDASGAAEDIVRNFGVAIASTIAGIALRIFINQMRRDPVEVERVSRLELADAARRVRRELDATVLDLNHFRRSAQQSATESWTGVQDQIDAQSKALITSFRQSADTLTRETAALATSSQGSVEEASRRMSASMEAAAARLSRETQHLSTRTAELSDAIGALTRRLSDIPTAPAVQTSDIAALDAKLDAVLALIEPKPGRPPHPRPVKQDALP
jgi:hypothetical protein